MKHLNIETPDRTIRINFRDGDISIAVDPDQAAQSDHPALEWSDTLLDGETVTLDEAEKAVAALGEGWRLPTRQELESLLDLSRHDPAIDPEKYPDTKSCFYWTSTQCAWNDAARWVVDFDGGSVLDSHRSSFGCVRAVRSGQ